MGYDESRRNTRNFQKQNENQPRIIPLKVKIFKSSNLADLIKTEAENVAEAFNEEHKAFKLNKNSQVRKFYDELQQFKQELESNADNKIADYLPLIYLVASKCAYAKGRELVGNNFYQFLKQNVVEITTKDELDEFLLYFEAILGFYRFLNPREN